MKYVIQKLSNFFNSKTFTYPSIKELQEFKISKRKNEISKNFRQYVISLNKKQNEWLHNNF